MQRNTIQIKGQSFGDDSLQIIAGPCTIENLDSLLSIASSLSEIGIKCLRGGAYKLRTSVHSFRGLGDIAIDYLQEAGQRFNMITVSEITEVAKVDYMAERIDVLLVGTRNMQNYPLLDRLGKFSNPIILKRGMAATITEWLQAAEYIVEAGNSNVILCERGIRTFEDATRNTLDISAVPVIKATSSFPIIVDPSHSTGKRELVKSMSFAAIAGGANGVMIETNHFPDQSLCDARQTVAINEFASFIAPLKSIWSIVNSA